MYFVIGADIVPTKSNIHLFANGNGDELVGAELKSVLYHSSFNIFNLETPLVDNESRIIKEGPNLIASTLSINGYKDLSINLLTLANNHIMDQGRMGLDSTVNTLKKHGISYLGTGTNLKEASRPFLFDFDGKKIGVYACVEHEFSVAEEATPGANPFDPLYSFDHIAELKNRSDYVVVLYHGGKEQYRYPSPLLQKTCHKFIEKGADLVICQHSHCIGCEEKYLRGTIVYGQGNFLFDDSDNDYWKTGLLVKVNNELTVSYLPIVKTGNGVRIADPIRGAEIMDNFVLRSNEIKEPGFIEEKYRSFADSFLFFYLQALSGRRSLVFRIFNKLSKGAFMNWYLRRTYQNKNKVRIANYIDCEAHRELLSQALADAYREREKL